MAKRYRILIVLLLLAIAGIITASIVVTRARSEEIAKISGAVLTRDKEVLKQSPVANASISLVGDIAVGPATSDATGSFQIRLKPGVRRGDTLTFKIRRQDFLPLDIQEPAGDQLYLLRISRSPSSPAQPSPVPIKNVRVRYTVPTPNAVNVGSAIKTFEITNQANVPCDHHGPCSPDGKWKASIGGTSLEAVDDNEFQGVRVSCIAGPCPFSKIESDQFSSGGRKVSVTVLNWSDTVVYLMEGEVVRNMVNDLVRTLYPAIFGQTMDFTLPATAKGPSIEAELNGADIVFPLGPVLNLDWARCTANQVTGGAKLYRCEVKQGFQFQ